MYVKNKLLQDADCQMLVQQTDPIFSKMAGY